MLCDGEERKAGMTNMGDIDPQEWESSLLEELRALGERSDPVPEAVLFAAQGSLAWLSVDSDLAELSYDSLVDTSPELVRSDDIVRLLTFQGRELTVEVEVTPVGRGSQLLGQLVPPQPARIEARWNDGSSEAQADGLGQFEISGVPHGPVSLRCHLDADGSTVDTGWLAL